MSSKYTSPQLWGPYFWFVMRCVAFNYPDRPTDNDVARTKQFFSSLQYVLPCDVCKKSYATHIVSISLDEGLKSKDALINWVEQIYAETQKNTPSQSSVPVQQPKQRDNIKSVGSKLLQKTTSTNRGTKTNVKLGVIPRPKPLPIVLNKVLMTNRVTHKTKQSSTTSRATSSIAHQQTKSIKSENKSYFSTERKIEVLQKTKILVKSDSNTNKNLANNKLKENKSFIVNKNCNCGKKR